MSHRQESSAVIALRDLSRMELETRHAEELRAAIDEAERRHAGERARLETERMRLDAERTRLEVALETATFRAGALTADLSEARTALAAVRDRPNSPPQSSSAWAIACALAWLCAAGMGVALLLRQPPARIVTVEVPAAPPLTVEPLRPRPIAPVAVEPPPAPKPVRTTRAPRAPQPKAAPVFKTCDGDPLCGLTEP